MRDVDKNGPTDAPTPSLLQTSTLVDKVLDEHRGYAEGDTRGSAGHRNHAQRDFNTLLPGLWRKHLDDTEIVDVAEVPV